MKHRGDKTGQLAKERLKLMAESEPLDCTPSAMTRMKKEIAEIISRYYEVSAENYEIKVILQQDKKRA